MMVTSDFAKLTLEEKFDVFHTLGVTDIRLHSTTTPGGPRWIVMTASVTGEGGTPDEAFADAHMECTKSITKTFTNYLGAPLE